jgi:hypothetical protein
MITQQEFSIIIEEAYRVRYFGELLQNKQPIEFYKDLTGLCGICSYFLYRALKKKNLQPVFNSTGGHCYIVVIGCVVDVTATQFPNVKEKILFKAPPFPGYNNHWGSAKSTTNKKDILRLFDKWETTQNPFDITTRKERKDLITLWKKVEAEDLKKIKEKVLN